MGYASQRMMWDMLSACSLAKSEAVGSVDILYALAYSRASTLLGSIGLHNCYNGEVYSAGNEPSGLQGRPP